jgi:hypothetical protein
MKALITATENGHTITSPSSTALAHWAYEAHCDECATCRRGETWCETGRALLAATAPISDLPGYPQL